MGGGISSLSKICVVNEASETGMVDFTFAQVGIRDGEIDMHGTCGNLMGAVALFAVDEGLVTPTVNGPGQLQVTIRDKNTAKLINARFPGVDGQVDWSDKFEISGVDGFGTRVATEYTNCGGTKTGKLWPTNNVVDSLVVDGQNIRASLVDGPNPAVFCDAEDLNLSQTDLETIATSTEVLSFLEQIRLTATVAMGIARDDTDAKRYRAIPKISLLSRPARGGQGIMATTLSMEVPHKAIPVTIALSLAIAMATEHSIPHRLATGPRIHHPTGFVDVEARLESPMGVTATVMRSAKRLMRGEIFLS